MCSAEVLVFAEALRRPVGARPSGPAGVCRRLFAGGDAAEPGRIARGMEEELRRRVAVRWNFDFEREAPLPGRYQWVPVGAKAKQLQPVREVRPYRKPVAKGRKGAGVPLVNQHKITDFMSKKKRPHAGEEPTSQKLKLPRLSEDRVAPTAGPT